MPVRKYRFAPSPFFFVLRRLRLQGSRQTVAEELPSVLQEQGFAIGQDAAAGGLPGFRLQLGGQIQGQLSDLALQRRWGQQRRFRA
jgi:hypothetical protein